MKRNHLCTGTAAITLVILTGTLTVTPGSAQGRCWSSLTCDGTLIMTGVSLEECCLGTSNGQTYDAVGGEACIGCFVFGWIGGDNFTGVEREQAYPIEVGFTKGGIVDIMLQFNVQVIQGSAIQGSDFTANNLVDIRPQGNNPATVTVNLRVDSVALEQDETFQLRLIPLNDASMDTDSNEFLIDTIEITIIDQDIVHIQFAESEYRGFEGESVIPVVVNRNLQIATNMTVRIIPLNFTEYIESGLAQPLDFPEVEDEDPLRPNRAKSFPIDRRDFNVESIEVTFEPDETTSTNLSVLVQIFDDEINEVKEEIYVLVLELASDNIEQTRVDFNGRNATLARIVDNDNITIGFEQMEYRFNESGLSFTEDDSPILLIKENEIVSEQTFTIIITAAPGNQTGFGDATIAVDFLAGGVFDIRPEQQNIRFPFVIIDDDLQEDTEAFQLQISSDGGLFQLGTTPAVVFIKDDDDVRGALVNDTVVGDPLLTVPIYVPNSQFDEISLCYEIHGADNQYFNFITDECASVNAHYGRVLESVNVVDEIAIRAVDNMYQCRNILVGLEDKCSVEIDGVPFTGFSYSNEGVSVRQYRNRVRVSVPNCDELTLIMWVFCESVLPDGRDLASIKFVVMRGLNFGHRNAHGLIGQFWNQPLTLAKFTSDGTPAEDQYIINFTRPGSEPRAFTGVFYPLAWNFKEGPCLYVGNRQAGPIAEIGNPNDSIIEGTYTDYLVADAFVTDFEFGLFNEDQLAQVRFFCFNGFNEESGACEGSILATVNNTQDCCFDPNSGGLGGGSYVAATGGECVSCMTFSVARVCFEQAEYIVQEGAAVELCVIKDVETAISTSVNLITEDESAESPADYIGGNFTAHFGTEAGARFCENILTVLDNTTEPANITFLVNVLTIPGSPLQICTPNTTRVFITGASSTDEQEGIPVAVIVGAAVGVALVTITVIMAALAVHICISKKKKNSATPQIPTSFNNAYQAQSSFTLTQNVAYGANDVDDGPNEEYDYI